MSEQCDACEAKDRRIDQLERFMAGISAVIDVALGREPEDATTEGHWVPEIKPTLEELQADLARWELEDQVKIDRLTTACREIDTRDWVDWLADVSNIDEGRCREHGAVNFEDVYAMASEIIALRSEVDAMREGFRESAEHQ